MFSKPKFEQPDVVVSGISGKFPSCNNVEEFKKKLLNGEEMTTEDLPWKLKDKNFPARIGRIPNARKFDASFFGVLPARAEATDPLGRLLMEASYEAIIDAGVNPDSLFDTNCGVYISSTPSESCQVALEPQECRKEQRSLFSASLCLLSQRISYWLGITGPTIVLDTGCSGSMVALDRAIADMQRGLIDSALVGGANLINLPYFTKLMVAENLLSKEGRCKSYDKDGDGFVRAEAVAVIFLQRKSVAKRIYCTIIHSRIGAEGYKDEGIACTSAVGQQKLLRLFYDECNFKPQDVGYIEGHGPGTKVGDPVECNAIDAVFNKGRIGHVTLGSCKSNMGHSEHVAGISSLIKIIIAMESGKMPGTLHFKQCRPDIPSLVSGRIKVNNITTPFNEKYATISSFGLGGSIAHVLLERPDKEKVALKKGDVDFPWLVLCSGRTEDAVRIMSEAATTNPVDPEFIKLIHDIHSQNIRNHPCRGYALLGRDGSRIQEVEYFQAEKRPITFVFSGMGSQWSKMGEKLLDIPVFSESIARINSILHPRGVDIFKILKSDEPGLFKYILNCFVGITAIQIALVDTLSYIGIKPDYIIGHSFGEIACAYADGCLTVEEAILTSYYRGLVSVESVFPPGAMAVIGLSCNEISSQLPDDVYVACHNSSISCTISGRKQAVHNFCKKLESQKVFVRELSISGIPYHTSLIANAGPKFLNAIKPVIREPKERTTRWISTSIAENQWLSPLAKYSSAEYHCHNFMSPVLFEEAFKKIPDNSILIEVAPRNSFRAILQSFNKRTKYISITGKNNPDNCQSFLEGIGRFYMEGGLPQIWKLYPNVEYPVSRGTRMISPLVRWNHDVDWYLPVYDDPGKNGIMYAIITSDDASAKDYIQDGIQVFPVSACIVKVWEAFADIFGKTMEETPVVFSDVVFKETLIISGRKALKIAIQRETQSFIVTLDGITVIYGKIRGVKNIERELFTVKADKQNPGRYLLPLKSSDIYKELRLRGLIVAERFKNITHIDHSLTTADVEWKNEWVGVIESLLQLSMIQTWTRNIQRPKNLKKLVINPTLITKISSNSVRTLIHGNTKSGWYLDWACIKIKRFTQSTNQIKFKINLPTFQRTITELKAIVDVESGIISCSDIQLTGLTFTESKPTKEYREPTLETYSLVPYVSTEPEKISKIMLYCTHIVLENITTHNPSILEVRSKSPPCGPLSLLFEDAVTSLGNYKCSLWAYGFKNTSGLYNVKNLKNETDGFYDVIITDKTSFEQNEELLRLLQPRGFIIFDLSVDAILSVPSYPSCLEYCSKESKIIMCKKKKIYKTYEVIFVDEDEDWLEKLKDCISEEILTILVSHSETSGIIGMTFSVVSETDCHNVRCFFILDDKAPSFDLNMPLYSDQFSKGLLFNILTTDGWGSYRMHPTLKENDQRQHVFFDGDGLVEGPLNRDWEIARDTSVAYYCAIDPDAPTPTGNQKHIAHFSGRNRDGERIMGISMNNFGSISSLFQSKIDLLWDVPDKWTLQDACAAVISYSKAILALRYIEGGASVLVTSAETPQGFAIVKTALSYGCTVFASCSSSNAAEHMKKMVPEINAKRIFENMDLSCAKEIKNNTNGEGVDCIILQGGILTRNLASSLASYGTLLMLGDNIKFDESYLPKHCHIQRFDYFSLLHNADAKRYLGESLKKLVETPVQPPGSVVHGIADIKQYLTRPTITDAVHLVKWRVEEIDQVIPPLEMFWEVTQRCWFCPHKSYIIIGGLGGFAMEMIGWMCNRGARKFVLSVRTPVKDGYQSYLIKSWIEMEVEISIVTEDITTEEGIKNIIHEGITLGPVDGIFNLAMILADASIPNMTMEMFEKVKGVKQTAALLLDKWSREYCPGLRYFVMFSSFRASNAVAGSLAYANACSAMERICEARVRDGFSGKALEWGKIGDIGALTTDINVSMTNLDEQPIVSCLEVLDSMLLNEATIPCSKLLANFGEARKEGVSVASRILELLGFKDAKALPKDSTLSDFGVDSVLVVLIKDTLEKEFNVFLTVKEVQKLTLADCETLV